MNYALLEDIELLSLVRKNKDKLAFRELYKRYSKEIFLVAYKKVRSKETAEELTQNLFLSLWERGQYTEIYNLRSWLFAAIKFGVINHYKSQIVHEKYVNYSKGEISAHSHTTDELASLHDLSEALEKGISLLPAKTQQVFRLSRFENRSIKEISRDLDISEKAVEYHITQSLRKMRVYLKDYLTLLVAITFMN